MTHLNNIIKQLHLSLLGLFLWTGITTAQTLNFNQFSIEDGLPQSGINSLVQDSIGNIWIGTMSGVSKYNGIKFENFNKKNGLAENRIVSSCVDKKKNIWFGHWAGGISVYLNKSKKFKHILPKGLDIFKTINYIFEDKAGNIWFGTGGQGLLKLAPVDYTLTEDTVSLVTLKFSVIKKKDGLSSEIINGIAQDVDKTLWVATDAGVTKIKLKSKGKYVFDYLNTLNGLPSNSITSVLCDSKHRIWLGSIDKGVFRLGAPSDYKIKVYNVDEGLSSNDVNIIFEDVEHQIFIGTFGGGVSKYLPSLELNNYQGPIFQTISTQQGLSNDKVLAILQDREKNIWIGTYLNLNQYFEEQFEIYGINEGLENNLVWSVIQDKVGNFWLGTEGGLIRFTQGQNVNENEFVYYTTYAVSGNKGKTTATTALYEDVEGKIWFTNYGNGVSRLDPKTKKITNYTVKDGLLSNEIFSITGDKDNNIWIGTNKGGAVKFDLKTKKFKHYTMDDGLGSNYIYSIFRDSKDRLWFGSLGGELTVYDGKFFRKIGEKDGYKNKFTVCITEDPHGNIWLGSYDGGIYKYDGQTFKNYSVKEGMSSETPFLMICDTKDNLWIGTSKGIDKFNLNDETFKHYGKEDGFLGIEINPNAVCKDDGGNLWFGTIIGVVKYNSKREKSNVIEPLTYLQDPRINFEKAEIPADHVFSYNQNHLTFDFVGASLTNPKRVKYKYMLEGLDKEWSPATKDNYVTYPTIPAGTYTFKVMAANNDGIWNKKPETFTFTVLPPWWKTKTFYMLSVILVVSVIVFYFRYRERQLRETNRILEEKVNQRTLELRQEKEVVELQNIEINQQKDELKHKNDDIVDSINAAQAIQGIILPPETTIKEMFSDAFVLYKPKDIVSGDFYWIHKENGKKYFAVVDCAGHGVPGAFMTMLGYSLFENAIKVDNKKDPAAMLKQIHEDLVSSLKKYTTTTVVKTGMDVALVVIDEKKSELVYAGARNPLYVVSDGVLTELKGSRMTIGVIPETDTAIEPGYENITHKVKKGDMLYGFSDGFPDQKGGPRNKKFYYDPFRELLTAVSKNSCEEQKKKLTQVIVDWRGNNEQLDDMLIMGVKI